jgi:nucleotide-binding universal stress UspA family protein
MLSIRTILHPTDFSENSDLAFRLACALAWDYGARLVVLHVVAPPATALHAEGVTIPPPAVPHEPLRDALHRLKPSDPQVVVEYRLIEGDAATEIVGLAEAMNCDVIFMGTHGRTGLSRVLMGSVAEQVLRKAPCPVVTVKKPFTEATTHCGPALESAAAPTEAAVHDPALAPRG